MKNIIILMLIGLPFLNLAQIQVFPGPLLHKIDSIFINYSANDASIFIKEINNFTQKHIHRLEKNVLGTDTLEVILFFEDYTTFPSQTQNDTTIQSDPSLNHPFNLIVKTYLDTNMYYNGQPPFIRRFYTIMDSVFIDKSSYQYSVPTLNINNYDIKDDLSNQISIFPNPTESILNINIPFHHDSFNFIIYNDIGRKVLYGNDKKINVSNLSNGVYLIHLITNKDVTIKKIIIQK